MRWSKVENKLFGFLRDRSKSFLLLITFSLCLQIGHAQLLSNQAKISVLTCAPGDDVLTGTIYGHSAIRVQDPSIGLDIVYNYGTFDSYQDGFIWKFLRGKLLYQLGKTRMDFFLQAYKGEQRGVKEQVLRLNQNQCQKFYDFLETNYLPKNRKYLYDFFYDNCATRITDLVHDLAPEFKYTGYDDTRTFRQHIKWYQHDHAWYNLGVDFILGAPADKNPSAREATFLPDQLSLYLGQLRNAEGKSMVADRNTLLKFDNPSRSSSGGMVPFYIIIALFNLELIIFLMYLKKTSRWVRWHDILWFFICSIVSFILFFMWFGTDHQTCGQNWNVLYFSPFYILGFIGLLINSYRLTKMACWAIVIILQIASILAIFLPQHYNMMFAGITAISTFICFRLIYSLKTQKIT